jgi:FMN phosphatase YigB (HAD superfamily)
MNIVIDIDNTLYHLDVIDKVSDLLGLDYKTEDVKHWVYDKEHINGFPKYFTDLVYSYFDDPKYMGNLDIYLGAKEKLVQWKSEGHNLYIISARKSNVAISTVKMLNRDFGAGFFKEIHFVEHKTDAKITLYRDLNIDMVIDDNPIDLEKSCELGIKVYAINNRYTGYNNIIIDKCLKIYDNIKKVECIGDIEL